MEKQSLILLHGALHTAAQFDALSVILSENFDVHALTFSGHGSEPLHESFSVNTFTADLEKFIEFRHLKHPMIFGYSLGGYVGLWLAARKPGLLGKVATLGTKFRWTPAYASAEYKKLDATVIMNRYPAFAKEMAMRHQHWEQLLKNTGDMMKLLGDNNLLNDDVLRSIQCPVMLMQGDRDRTIQPGETIDVFRAIPDARLHILPATPHPYEKTDITLLAHSLIRFFTGHEV